VFDDTNAVTLEGASKHFNSVTAVSDLGLCVGVLMYGKRPSPEEVLRWLKWRSRVHATALQPLDFFCALDRRHRTGAERHVLDLSAVFVFALEVFEFVGPAVLLAEATAEGLLPSTARAFPLD
jgi:hypothetical protein